MRRAHRISSVTTYLYTHAEFTEDLNLVFRNKLCKCDKETGLKCGLPLDGCAIAKVSHAISYRLA